MLTSQMVSYMPQSINQSRITLLLLLLLLVLLSHRKTLLAHHNHN
jgi:hypothetical protein